MIDPVAAVGWLKAGQAALDMMKTAWKALPSGTAKDELGEKIKEAGDALARSDVQLAKELKYPLCKCTFPPQIMLWKQQTQSYDCPNSVCGRQIKTETAASRRKSNWLDDGF